MSEPKITPLARRLAEENGIDWRRLKGTGPEGEITERDILNFLAKVMAGEVTLEGPPPGEPPPPEGQADLEAARAALEKEGIPLDELIPREQASPELTAEFEFEFEEEEEPAPREVEPEPPQVVEPPPTWKEETIVEELAPREVEPPAPAEPEEVVAPPPPEEPEPEPEPEVAAVAAPTAPEAASAPAPAALEGVVALKSVNPEAWRGFLAELEGLGVEVPEEALFFLAVQRALADLEVPLRPLREGKRVAPAEGFSAFLRAWSEPEEEAEGLEVVLGELPLRVRLPAVVLMPDGTLLLVGPLPEGAEGLLDRVAHYLERPLRLVLL